MSMDKEMLVLFKKLYPNLRKPESIKDALYLVLFDKQAELIAEKCKKQKHTREKGAE